MLHLVLWIILAVWVGIALLVLFGVVAAIGFATIRMLLDRRGVTGSVWCPLLQRTMEVLGPPAAFVGEPSGFADVRRCERFGKGHVQCHKWCVRTGELVGAAPTN